MNNTKILTENISLAYGTIDEEEMFVDSEMIDADISEQEYEAKRSILRNLICVTSTLAILVIIVSTVSTDPVI